MKKFLLMIMLLLSAHAEAAWFGMKYGLLKYDNTGWEIYNKDNSGLPDDYIADLVVDNAGSLWVGTKAYGFVK